ncbi:hypothetical protein H4S06_000636 [Coemansia sp. BCRC 34490]|nr:hypothetical protein H4S06_000636 [Coemansia sp. BCRC 34490]
MVNKLYSLFAQFHRLIPLKSKISGRGSRANAKKPTVQVMVRNELQMYEPVKAFVCFVSECIRLQASPETLPKRLVVPFGKTDVRPKDSEHDWRIDIALRCVPFQRKSPPNPIFNSSAVTDPAKLEERPEIADTFAYMELKYRKKNMDDALAQLFRYTKEIYMAQHDRRFVWGIAMCSSVLQSCVFGSNYAATSENMDIAAPAGRKAFVQLLVNWSFCESHKLGYDPTISYDYKAHCLAIQATSSDRDGRVTTKTFYSREVLVCAERMFGRHTRCFKATATKPLPLTDTDVRPPHEQMADCNVIIKDAWAEAPENADEDPRDEARHLAVIKAGLADVPTVRGMYPELCSDCDSGRVRFIDPLSKASYEDTTRTALGENVWSQISESTALRVHKRNFIQGVGKPIKYVRSVPELVIVAADVMRCHWELIDKCGVLHRDISVNNILVRRGSDGDARGMLIDFDHSISIDTVEGYPRAERTGTLQFMSIRNLENTNLKPTALDDWESMLYILCWLGTYGWNSKTRLSNANSGRLSRKVERWCTGPLETISDAKRSDLDSENNFQRIIQDFNPELENIDLLFDLVARLRSVLIEEHSDELRGALTNRKFQLNKETRIFESVVIRDPFEKRSEEWKNISKLLLQEMEKYAQLARERLSSS